MLEKDFDTIFLIAKENKEYCIPLLKDKSAQFLEDDNALSAILSKDDILWVDGYSFDNSWRDKFRPYVLKLVYVNDFPNDIQGADVVLNHCPGIESKNFNISNNIEFLLGLPYALLRPV